MNSLIFIVFLLLVSLLISVRRFRIANEFSRNDHPKYRVQCEYTNDEGFPAGFLFSSRTTNAGTMLVYNDRMILIPGIGGNSTIYFKDILETGLQEESVGILFFLEYRNPPFKEKLYFKLDDPQKIKDFIDGTFGAGPSGSGRKK